MDTPYTLDTPINEINWLPDAHQNTRLTKALQKTFFEEQKNWEKLL